MGIKADGIRTEIFVKEYEKFATDRSKDDYIKTNLRVEEYVPMLKKSSTAISIAKRTTHAIDENDSSKNTDEIEMNSPARYIIFTLSVIDLYTNIIIEHEDIFNEYDMLAKSGLLQKIMTVIPRNEIEDFKTLLDMAVSDILQNEFSTQAFVHKEITRIGDLLKVIVPPLVNPVVDKVNQMVDGLNLDEETMGKIVEFAKVKDGEENK